MVSAGDFKNGLTIEIEGNIYPDSGIPARKTWERCSVRKNKTEKHHQWWCSREDIPSDREVRECSHREKGNAVSVSGWRSV